MRTPLLQTDPTQKCRILAQKMDLIWPKYQKDFFRLISQNKFLELNLPISMSPWSDDIGEVWHQNNVFNFDGI